MAHWRDRREEATQEEEDIYQTWARSGLGIDCLPTTPLPIISIDQLPTSSLPGVSIDRLPTQPLRRVSSRRQPRLDDRPVAGPFIDELDTVILPAIQRELIAEQTGKRPIAVPGAAGSYLTVLRGLVKTSGIYAVASLGAPLISLLLSPFLAHHLSPADYGLLTVLTTAVSLGAGITQMGLGSAFFRAYNYDYTLSGERRSVLSTTFLLLAIVAVLLAFGTALSAPVLARLLMGQPAQANLITLTAIVILLQNLTIPGFSWLRAENRAVLYSCLSLGNLLINLIGTVVLVGFLNLGIAGALIASAGGYACILLGTLPILLLRGSIRIRADIARSMLAFGLPLTLNFTSYWVLQASDRYLLSVLGSLAQTASYAVAYNLGSAVAVVVIGPFTLAWPSTMFAIAKRRDAPQAFRLVFRWLGLFLLFAAFGLSLASTILLDWLFPASYHSAALVIPVIAESIVFYGIYFLFMVGANIKRKTWLAAVFTTLAALLNMTLNLILIPAYLSMGAAISTLVAFLILAAMAYLINQQIYPIPFEIIRFVLALLLGNALYIGGVVLPGLWEPAWKWPLSILGLLVYTLLLLLLARGRRAFQLLRPRSHGSVR